MTYRNWTRIVSLLLPRVIQGFAPPLRLPFKAGPWYFHPVLPNSPSLSEPHSACNLLGSSPSAFQTLFFPHLCPFTHSAHSGNWNCGLTILLSKITFNSPPQTIFRSSDVDLFLTVFFLHWFLSKFIIMHSYNALAMFPPGKGCPTLVHWHSPVQWWYQLRVDGGDLTLQGIQVWRREQELTWNERRLSKVVFPLFPFLLWEFSLILFA